MQNLIQNNTSVNRTLLKSTFAILSLVIILGVEGCKKKSDATASTAPSVLTANIIMAVTATSAQSGGTLITAGDATVTANGVCWSSTSSTPTIANSKTSDSVHTSTTPFISNITGLTANTTYYVRAYATSSVGTSYGSVIKFTTNSSAGGPVAAVTIYAGSQTPGFADGGLTSALFNSPQGVYADASGNVYVGDTFNSSIRLISGGQVTTLAGNGQIGYAQGLGAVAQFYGPQDMVKDASGNLYVADQGNNVIRKITPDGTVSTFAGSGIAGYYNSTTASSAQFRGPRGLAIDSKGNIYVADRDNNVIRRITPAGAVSRYAGYPKATYFDATEDTTNSVYSGFHSPTSLAFDASGNLYVADAGNYAIRKITPARVVTTVAGGPNQTDVVGTPAGIAVDSQGNFFISDQSGRVLELTKDNVLYPLAGTAGVNSFANGSGTAAQFNSPQGLTVDASGIIYVADYNNNCIRKLVVTVPSN